jgi:hypothetical protein
MTDDDLKEAREFVADQFRIDIKAGRFSAHYASQLRAWEMRCWAEQFEHDEERQDAWSSGWDESRVRTLIDEASAGSAESHQAVCEIIAEHIKYETPPPSFLRDFLLDLLSGKRTKPKNRKKGWNPSDRYGRDECIWSVVRQLIQGGGLNRTRDPKRTNRPSACSIVAEVLAELGVPRISERAIEEITRSPPRTAPSDTYF